jgi:hypothetical protein
MLSRPYFDLDVAADAAPVRFTCGDLRGYA